MRYEIRSRFTGAVQFTAPIDCAENAPASMQRGLAVKWALKNGANLRSANLSGADLNGAYLRSADLRSADLNGADLSGADLSGADLSGADLRSANLRSANLNGADLRSADLSGADLSGADLRSADLNGADLSGANLRSADLSGAQGADLAIARTRILPDGDLIGWKKCLNGVVVKLRIPADARRSHAFGRKCRAEFADVLEIIGADVGISEHAPRAEYRTGTRVTPHEWSEDWQEECAGGIHFYITRTEAENH